MAVLSMARRWSSRTRTAASGDPWRSTTLSALSLFSLFTVEVGFIIAIAVLLSYSQKKSGFVQVAGGEDSSFFPSTPAEIQSIWGQGLLWTALPTLLFTLYRLYWDSVVSCCQEEAPYAELAKGGGCRATRSILLDYRSYSAYQVWLIAFKNGHWVLGMSILFSFVVSLILVPLSARMFAAQSVSLNRPASMEITKVFDQQSLNASIDFQPVFDSVSAVRLHGGRAPDWTDGEYAFPAFDLAATETASANVTSISVNVTAQSAYLSCRTIADYSISRLDSTLGSTLTVTATDDGCDIEIRGGIANGTAIFLKPASITTCSVVANYSRLSFLTGYYDIQQPYLLKDLSIVSCTPIYRQTHGLLSKSYSIAASPTLSFTPDNTNTTTTRPNHWLSFETSIQQLSNFNPDQPDFSTAYGNLLLAYAKSTAATQPISPETISLAATVVFTTIYAFLSASTIFQPIATAPLPAPVPGTATLSQTRLHLIPWVAYTMTGILSLLAFQTILIAIHLRRNPTILHERPVGLIGAAGLLYKSDIHELVHEARTQQSGGGGGSGDGRLMAWLEGKYDLNTAECRVDGNTPGEERIMLTRWEEVGT